MDDAACRQIVVTGMVQGLGFRPYVYRLAQNWGLKGWVLNSGHGVTIEIQGPVSSIEGFYRDLPAKKPPLAQIVNLKYKTVPLKNYQDFRILASRRSQNSQVLVPPDLAICPECRAEVLAEGERYHNYPFTNCTYCGPRFTVIKGLPYDRERTSMAEFPMCPECNEDYHNPGHRRFHAQPTACNFCGPQVSLYDKNGSPVAGDWLENVRRLIAHGKIVAVKGIGGFHLVCSALDPTAIMRLRTAKKRPFRPLAVMARDLETVKRYCRLSEEEAALLTSPAAPIVILDTLQDEKQTNTQGALSSNDQGTLSSNDQNTSNAEYGVPVNAHDSLSTNVQSAMLADAKDTLEANVPSMLPGALSPHNPTLGVMLPYSPLHLLLFSENIDLLVMTSGNARGLPIVKDNEEALKYLSPFTDYFLLHNREIVVRCDDSVVRQVAGETQYLRRSRGYAPSPLQLPFSVSNHVLGMGSEMKNTLCLLKDHQAFLSQHIGEMDSLESLENYKTILEHLQGLFKIQPLIIGYDPHPNSNLQVLLNELQKASEPLQTPPAAFPIQHHHAHMAAVMAENGLEGDVIGAILDGTGYGLDGTLWGFEILAGNYTRFDRLVHLAEVPLPGGEKAIRTPWIVAAAYLLTNFGEEEKKLAAKFFPEHVQELPILERMISMNINTPRASSAGRLFEAVAALTGICLENTYDGQAAIELGELARMTYHSLSPGASQALKKGPLTNKSNRSPLNGTGWIKPPYTFVLNNGIIETSRLIQEIVWDRESGQAPQEIALKFHYTVAAMVVAGIQYAHAVTKLKRVVLSGGVWQNPLLLGLASEALIEKGFQVFTHRQVPANDGGLALGQAVAAYHMWKDTQPMPKGHTISPLYSPMDNISCQRGKHTEPNNKHFDAVHFDQGNLKQRFR